MHQKGSKLLRLPVANLIIILLQECVSFYFWNAADVPHTQGSAGFCSLVAIFRDVYPTFANYWQSCHIPALTSISLSAFFVPSPCNCSAFTGTLSSSILYTCPNHHNLCSLRNSSNLSTPVILGIFSLFILYFKVLPHIIRISVVFNFLSSSTFNAQHSAP